MAQYDGWPRLEDLDFDCIRAQCEAVGDRAVFFMGDRLNRIAPFKPGQYLRGVEQITMDAALAPELFGALVAADLGFCHSDGVVRAPYELPSCPWVSRSLCGAWLKKMIFSTLTSSFLSTCGVGFSSRPA